MTCLPESHCKVSIIKKEILAELYGKYIVQIQEATKYSLTGLASIGFPTACHTLGYIKVC